MSLTFVTGNENKWAEIQAILGTTIPLRREKIDCIGIAVCNITLMSTVPEIQGRIVEVAKEKSRIASLKVGGPVLIEDTALCFDALGPELPGPYIKWFLEDLGHDGLNRLLAGFDSKAARAICTFAYCEAPEADPIVFQGVTKGRIVEARGPKKFGWDPVFEPDHPSGQTYAEMPAEVKNSISHRAKALHLVKEYFSKT